MKDAISTVNKGKTIVSMLNISEESENIIKDDLNKIVYDNEYEIYSIKTKNKNYNE